MLAYVFWHRPAAGVERETYERELLRFHHSLQRRPPSGFRGSCPFRLAGFPWRETCDSDGAGERGGSSETGAAAWPYEDWYLVDSWSAVGVLEEAALARGHVSSHDAVARHAGFGTGAVYRLIDGTPCLERLHASVWVTRPLGRGVPPLADLLADGIDAECTSLWQRCLTLGPAPELCMLGEDVAAMGALTGLAAGRLPDGWRTSAHERVPLSGA
jgi:hypothetical protein